MTSWKNGPTFFQMPTFLLKMEEDPIFVHRFGSQFMDKISKNHTTGDSFHIKGITTTTSQIFSWISLGIFGDCHGRSQFLELFFCHQKLFENVGIGWSFCFKKND